MDKFNAKLQEVQLHFQSNDLDLGYRKLLDCVLDTSKLDLFKKVVELENWKETQENIDPLELKSVYLQLFDWVKNEKVESQDGTSLILSAKNISKSYGKNKFGLSDVSIELHKGQIIGLVGENGNGKTTLLRILAKEIQADSGEIQVNLKKNYSSTFDLRTKLTYVPQRTPTWYGSLLDNLKFCASNYGIKGEMNEYYVYMMVIRFGLWKYRFLKWSELSSGYKMRFELARTFLRAPEVLFLDEPLANLDVVSQQLILEDLKNLAGSISSPLAIVLSSQQLFEVEKIADSVLFLKKGKPQFNSAQMEGDSHIIELEVDATKMLLEEALSDFEIENIHFNGGMFTLTFNKSQSIEAILQKLISKSIKIKYFRDISQSTKRLFQ
ncbi:MAG: ABC transporter ATP-binding protein [Flavobacteriaceae bacterium]|nr:MAG: ABC transporter ATP-binding protein [Flavobacteriaceae bacterium]